MMNSLSVAVSCAATLGAAVLPYLSREEESVEAMIARVDDALLYRLSLALDADGMWAAIHGVRGLPHLIRQGRLLFGVVVETNKQNGGGLNCMARADELSQHLVPVWRALLHSLTDRKRVTSIFYAVTGLAKCYDLALDVIDAATPNRA